MQIVVTSPAQGHPVRVACPKCQLEYNLDALVQGQGSHMSTVRCSCGEHFLAVVNARQFDRKSISIRGMYTVLSDSGLGGLVTLRDISEGGVGFTLSVPCELEPGWLITIVFELVGRERRIIVAKATIRSVHGVEIGCAFVNPEQVRQDILTYFNSQGMEF